MSNNNQYCAKTPTPESTSTAGASNIPLEGDASCINTLGDSRSGSHMGSPRGDGLNAVLSQTLSENGNNPNNPNSCSKAATPRGDEGSSCYDDPRKLAESRNPITGLGLQGDGVGGWKPKTAKQREGNPVTGEGYTGPVNIPGVHPVVNKNRVPPGGYSSGLW